MCSQTQKNKRTIFIPQSFFPLLLQAFEKQKKAQKNTSQLESKSEERERVERFKTRENSIVSKPINPFTSGTCVYHLKLTGIGNTKLL